MHPMSSVADERLTVMGLLAETWAALTTHTSAHLASFGLAPAEFEVCLRLARSPEGMLRMSALAAQTTLSSSGVTRVVDRLVERGLVVRRDCPGDRRATNAVLSDAGRDLLARLLPGHLDLLQRWLIDPLSADDDPRGEQMASFEAGLRAVRDHCAPCSTAGIT